jgi:hypothetical protein
MPRWGFELMIPVLEGAKTVHGLDRAATVIIRKLLDRVFKILEIFIRLWNIQTYLYRMFFPYGCLNKI